MIYPLIGLIGLLACGTETAVNQIFPVISVAPAQLEFSEQPIQSVAYEDLYISNAGRAQLNVSLQFSGDAVFSAEPAEFTVAAGDTFTLPVGFLPSTYLSYNGTLTITSDDPDDPSVEVPLTGVGVPAPVPDIDLSLSALDFGAVPPSSSQTLFVQVSNVGSADLTLGSITQDGSGAFTVVSDPSGGVVSPGASSAIVLSYLPTQDQGDSGTLIIPSDDPDEPSVEVLLLGNGGGDFAYPVASIDCPSAAKPPEWITLDGALSSDPNGQTLSYEWTYAQKPGGSQSELSTLVGTQTSFFADIAGDYEVQLVVVNAIGVRSAPEKCAFSAIPDDEVHIELTWDTRNADLDLHVAEEGAEFFSKPGDCTYCNPNPDWGQSGTTDDPRLDLDDRGGYGPENINIQFPTNGSYSVKVHYYDDHGDGDVSATVRFYVYGVKVEEVSKIVRRNEIWDVAELRLPAGTVGLQSNALYPATDRTCW